LLVVTNKNHGQPFVQYAEISEPFLMGASYCTEEVPLNLGSLISAFGQINQCLNFDYQFLR